MNDRKAKLLVVGAAILLLVMGFVLYLIFEKQGYGKNKISKYINYNVNDYVEVSPVVFNDYSDVYSSINVSKVKIKNIREEITEEFHEDEEEIINYITGYYKEIEKDSNYFPLSTVSSSIKMQVNGAVLSVFYGLDFNLDENEFDNNIKSYVVTANIDLGTEKLLSNDDLLLKYDYTKAYIAEKLFNEDILISNGQIVVDKNTNISLTKSDIERKKDEYIARIISEFDNIIKMYIENNSLVLVYDKKELNGVFFNNNFDTEIKVRYLK